MLGVGGRFNTGFYNIDPLPSLPEQSSDGSSMSSVWASAAPPPLDMCPPSSSSELDTTVLLEEDCFHENGRLLHLPPPRGALTGELHT